MLMVAGTQPAGACICKPSSKALAPPSMTARLSLHLPSDRLEDLRTRSPMLHTKRAYTGCASRLQAV